MDQQAWRHVGPDLNMVYQDAREVDEVVEGIEVIARRENPGGDTVPVVSVYFEPGSQSWTAAVSGADGTVLGSATCDTEIMACRTLLGMLEADHRSNHTSATRA